MNEDMITIEDKTRIEKQVDDNLMPKAAEERDQEIVTLAGAVPHSAVNLGCQDSEGNSLYTLVCMKQDV
jgi:hypothetical protein